MLKNHYEQTMKGVRLWTGDMEVEQQALQQIRNISMLPILAGHIAIMPDVHFGMGATVGSVIPTRGAIIPAAVGVDIGCGMVAMKTQLSAADLPDNLKQIRYQIERDVPVGFNYHDDMVAPGKQGLEGLALKRRVDALMPRFDALQIMARVGKFNHKRMWQQLGTLGGGNHFIELCLDESQGVWIMLHSGSRNVGKTVGEAAVTTARELARQNQTHLPDRDLAWLDEGSQEFDDYIAALRWCQDYAALNRDIMLHLVKRALEHALGRKIEAQVEAINCHHNYANLEEHFGEQIWVTRKGAVSAREGQLGIIPGSMGVKSYIVRGKGHTDAYASCSHGAGRRMSRGEAKRRFSQADLAQQTAGVECRKDSGVVDEIPGAYKSIDEVMAAQSDLVEVVHTLKQVLCVKG
jgi:tRNA-splicing ligase RtcB (3'-phosphate/5'-hydroxy nucleic acid ligase)